MVKGAKRTRYNPKVDKIRIPDDRWDMEISNELNPIANLPVEVLRKIFHCTRVAPRYMEKCFYTARDLKLVRIDWIAVSWVCQHWRTTALNDPTLWNDLPFDFPTWVAEMLDRSKNAGLVVDLYQDVDVSLLSKVFGQVARIAKLSVEGGERFTTLTNNFPFQSTPELKKLGISDDGWGSDHSNIRLSEELFADACKINDLELKHVDVNWNSHLFAQPLKHLKLEQISASAKPTLAEARTIMGRISETLQSLTLWNAFPGEDEIQSSTEAAPPIVMTALQRITLGGAKPSEISSLLRMLDLTNEAQYVHIFTYLRNGVGPDYIDMLGLLGGQQTFGAIVSNSQSVLISGEIVGTKKVKKWQDFHLILNTFNSLLVDLPEDYDFDDTDRALPGLDLEIRGPRAESSVTTLPFRCVFTDLFNTFCWENLRNFCINGFEAKSYPEFGQVLVRTFGTLPSIENVQVGSKSVDYFIDALNYIAPTREGSTPVIAFKGVSEIMMVNVNIQSRLDKIGMCMLRRTEWGSPIRELDFRGCRGKTVKYLKQLKELVSNVYWDGHKF